MDNYEKQVYTGRELFLKYDQDKLIEKYGLKHDEEYLYLIYIETEYRINRRNGAIEYATGEEWTDCREYTVVMTIYDFLCCSAEHRNNLVFTIKYKNPASNSKVIAGFFIC